MIPVLILPMKKEGCRRNGAGCQICPISLASHGYLSKMLISLPRPLRMNLPCLFYWNIPRHQPVPLVFEKDVIFGGNGGVARHSSLGKESDVPWG